MGSPDSSKAIVVRLWPVRLVNFVLAIGLIAYVGTAVAFAVLLLRQAYATSTLSNFSSVAVGATIAVVGTAMTALAALYAANRQSEVAQLIERSRQAAALQLADFQANLTSQLNENAASAAQTLERLKKSLDFSTVAYRELAGSAAFYFYAIRSSALVEWDEEALKKAEGMMVEASRHLIYVPEDVAGKWYALWQQAQALAREARKPPDAQSRMNSLDNLLENPTKEFDIRSGYNDFSKLVKGRLADGSDGSKSEDKSRGAETS